MTEVSKEKSTNSEKTRLAYFYYCLGNTCLPGLCPTPHCSSDSGLAGERTHMPLQDSTGDFNIRAPINSVGACNIFHITEQHST